MVVTIAGETVSLPVLDIEDLLALGREVLHERKLAELKPIPIQDTAGRQNVTAFYDSAELEIDDLIKLTLTLSGAKRFIVAAAKKGGMDDPDAFATKAAKALGFRSMINLAAMVSGIWPQPEKKPEQPSPNDGAAGATAEPAASPNP